MPEQRLQKTRDAYNGWSSVPIQLGDVCEIDPQLRPLFGGASRIILGPIVHEPLTRHCKGDYGHPEEPTAETPWAV